MKKRPGKERAHRKANNEINTWAKFFSCLLLRLLLLFVYVFRKRKILILVVRLLVQTVFRHSFGSCYSYSCFCAVSLSAWIRCCHCECGAVVFMMCATSTRVSYISTFAAMPTIYMANIWCGVHADPSMWYEWVCFSFDFVLYHHYYCA